LSPQLSVEIDAVREDAFVNDQQKSGGIAALVLAATFVIGIAVFAGVLLGSAFESSEPVEVVGFLAAHQAMLSIWYVIIYVVFGIALVVLTLALHERLKSAAPAITQPATAFGLIWSGLVIASGMIAVVGINTVVDLYDRDPAQAGTVWSAIDAVQLGIGGGIELVGALWVLLVSLAALRVSVFPRSLNYLGVVIGVSGVLTIVPALAAFGAVFGLGLIAWFAWLGRVMLRGYQDNRMVRSGMGTSPRLP
jgi:hypothetical protein